MTTHINDDSMNEEEINEENMRDSASEQVEGAAGETPLEEMTDEDAAKGVAQQLKELSQKAEENMEGWRRAQADYQNLQKETQRRMQEINKFATQQFILELLPMVDHFQYALQGIPEEDRDNAWVKGIEYIQKNFMQILEGHGVQTIEAAGQPFNPEMHEALEEVDGDGKQESGTVAEVVANGFTLNGKVIQVAKVKVVK